jgi:hypothetical protein
MIGSSSQSFNQSICFDSAQYSKFPIFHYSRSVVLLYFLLLLHYQHPDASTITPLPFFLFLYHKLPDSSVLPHEYSFNCPIFQISNFPLFQECSFIEFSFITPLPVSGFFSYYPITIFFIPLSQASGSTSFTTSVFIQLPNIPIFQSLFFSFLLITLSPYYFITFSLLLFHLSYELILIYRYLSQRGIK